MTAAGADIMADLVIRWRADGWQGRLLGGPDLAKTWFAERSGEDGEGALALLCGSISATGDSTTALAEKGIDSLINALETAIAKSGTPTRQNVAAALHIAPEPTTWATLAAGDWEPE